MQLAVQQTGGRELYRLSKSKAEVDVAPNTIRAWFKLGLPFYKRGKMIFISRAETVAFIRGELPPSAPAKARKQSTKTALAA
jgi:hypothetical protein